MLATPVFQLQPALDANFKITAVDYCDGKLYVGDENGVVHKFLVKTDQPNIIPSTKDAPTVKLSKGKVQGIKHLQYVNQILVHTDKQLYLLDGETLLKLQEIVNANQKDCEMFALDEDPQTSQRTIARLLVLRSDSKIVFYDHEKHDKGLFTVKSDNTKLTMKPTAIAWYNRNIFIGFEKKSYQVLDFETRRFKDIEIFKDFVVLKHLIKIISDEETLLLGHADCFIPINTNTCDKLDQNTIQGMPKIAGISVLDPYIVVLGENKIQIFNKLYIRNRSRLLQDLTFETSGSNVGKAITVTSNKLFFATTTKVYYLSPIPYDQQIIKCLLEGRVEDAFMIFDQYVPEGDPERQRKLDALKIDAAWVHFKDLKFRETENIIQDLNYDIKEFLALFLNYIPNKVFFDSKSILTISLFLEDARKRPSADNELKKDPTKAIKTAREFLSRILENRRKYLLDNYGKNLKEYPEFISSESFSPFKDEIRQGKVSKLTVEEHLEIIDYALLRLNLDLQREDQLNNLLSKTLFCGNYYKDLEHYFKEEQRPSDAIQAKFYEQFGRYKEALEKWSESLSLTDKSKVDRACEEIIRILTTKTYVFKEAREKEVLFEYLTKVLLKNTNYARKFFLDIDEKSISPESIEKFLTKRWGETSYLKEIFYEVLVNEKKIEDERFHTTLASHYLKCIFEARKKDQKLIDYKREPQKDLKLSDYLKKFHNFLRDPSARYSPEAILVQIKDSWLLDDEIYLYGVIKQHNEALNKLLDLGRFSEAEKYCADKQERLLTKLFELYIRKYDECSENLRHKPGDQKCISDKEDVVKVIHTFLKKYAAHPQLDPATVIDKIPDDWDLWENKSDSGVYSFLFYSLSSTLHAKRNAKVAKYLSELDSLDTQYKLLKAQSAHVTITSNRRCALCNKAIGRAVFVVYPNGVIAHLTCSQDKLTVCPVTKQNFEKTFSG